jgi:pimeloyl-ACP methyl ester carboxylesterase
MKAIVAVAFLASIVSAQQPVIVPSPHGGQIHADLYGKAGRAVLLAHGGRFNKESWKKQAQELEASGFRVMAIELGGRDYDSLPAEILACVRYLRKTGAKTVSIVGASFGGEAAANASVESNPGEIDRLVLLAAWTDRPPEKLKGRKLFIVARDDASSDGPRLPKIRANYEKAKGPKKLVILEGSAHAQFLFATDQSERLMREILNFLTAP